MNRVARTIAGLLAAAALVGGAASAANAANAANADTALASGAAEQNRGIVLVEAPSHSTDAFDWE